MKLTTTAFLALPLADAKPYSFLLPRQTFDLASEAAGNITFTQANATALNMTLNSFPDNSTDIGFTIFTIQGQSNDIVTSINNTILATNMSSMFTTSESQDIYSRLSSLVPVTNDLLANFAAHCPTFQNDGAKGAVLAGLIEQRELSREEGNALVLKLAAPYAMSASSGSAAILSAFDNAISVYQLSSCPGPSSTSSPTVSATPMMTSSFSARSSSMSSIVSSSLRSSALSTTPMMTISSSSAGTTSKPIALSSSSIGRSSAPFGNSSIPAGLYPTSTTTPFNVPTTIDMTKSEPPSTVVFTAPPSTLTFMAPPSTVTYNAPPATITKTETLPAATGIETVTAGPYGAPPATVTITEAPAPPKTETIMAPAYNVPPNTVTMMQPPATVTMTQVLTAAPKTETVTACPNNGPPATVTVVQSPVTVTKTEVSTKVQINACPTEPPTSYKSEPVAVRSGFTAAPGNATYH